MEEEEQEEKKYEKKIDLLLFFFFIFSDGYILFKEQHNKKINNREREISLYSCFIFCYKFFILFQIK